MGKHSWSECSLISTARSAEILNPRLSCKNGSKMVKTKFRGIQCWVSTISRRRIWDTTCIAILHKVGNKQGLDMQTASRTKMTIMQQPDWIDGASRFPK